MKILRLETGGGTQRKRAVKQPRRPPHSPLWVCVFPLRALLLCDTCLTQPGGVAPKGGWACTGVPPVRRGCLGGCKDGCFRIQPWPYHWPQRAPPQT